MRDMQEFDEGDCGERLKKIGQAKWAPLRNVPVDSFAISAPGWSPVGYNFAVGGFPVESVSIVGTVAHWSEERLDDLSDSSFLIGIRYGITANGRCTVFQPVDVEKLLGAEGPDIVQRFLSTKVMPKEQAIGPKQQGPSWDVARALVARAADDYS